MTTDSQSRPKISRLPSLTGLRFAAAVLVFLTHTVDENVFRDLGVGKAYGEALRNVGYSGVSFFFILSGFVLAWAYRPGDRAVEFWRRRAAKIYPSHLVTALAAVVLLQVSAGQLPAVRQWLSNLLLVQSWFPQIDVTFGLNPVSWSLACEALFYLAFPLLAAGVRRIRTERLWYWLGALAVLVWCVPFATSLLPATPQYAGVSIPRFWFVYAFPPVRALEFVIGIMLARLVLAGKWPKISLLWPGLLVVLGYLLQQRVPDSWALAAAQLVPMAVLVASAASADVRGAGSVFRGRVLVRLGEWSLAFYLIHQMILVYGHRALGAGRTWSTWEAAGVLLLALGCTVLLAGVLHTVVERPLYRELGRRRSGPVRDSAPERELVGVGGGGVG
ncbi:acyltransferase family protein [Kitasatospora azatica]|uniref:acyltransferase family protein n=1 Tax=Kitasatospora azatica TaxID=58347 RepID=UPI00068C560B|nr:acyltransferase [Kitasatospora azatica]